MRGHDSRAVLFGHWVRAPARHLGHFLEISRRPWRAYSYSHAYGATQSSQ